MKKLLSAIFVFAAGLAGIALAQTSAQSKASPAKKAQPKGVQSRTAPTQLKIGVVRTRDMLAETIDGKRAIAGMNTAFEARKEDLEKRKIAITDLQLRLSLGEKTLSPEAKADLTSTIDQQTRDQNRLVEDMQAEVTQEEEKIIGQLGQKLIRVVREYALANGFTAVIDASSASVVYASNAIDITKEIAVLYDKSPPAMPAEPAAKK